MGRKRTELHPTKKALYEGIINHRKEIQEWYSAQAKQNPPPFYCSVDLRDSGHKIVPVDSNLFPAGFNNICPDDIRTASAVFRAQIDAEAARAQIETPNRVLIIPESHTTNTYYAENLFYLSSVLQSAGYEVRIGWIGALPEGTTADQPVILKSVTHKEILAYPIQIEGRRIRAGGFDPEVILLNNDFSGGYPKSLDDIEQPIFPSHVLGWHSRKKSEHFVNYNRLAGEFAQIVKIDPWLIQVETQEVGPVNFNEDQGTEEVAQVVQRILESTKAAYIKHHVEQEPFAFVKNNSGTYGMGIMVVHSAEELRTMNRRTKNKMSMGKNKAPIASVVVQEGVPTATLVDRLAAEPVIYLVGCELIGGFLRTNAERGIQDNLNSPGMVFRKLCMSDLREEDLETGEQYPVLELVYGAIARISALATGIELKDHLNHRSL